MSRGLRVLHHSDLVMPSGPREIVQRYVEGIDATVGVLRAPYGGFQIIGAQTLLPDEDVAGSWVFSEEAKLSEGRERTDFTRAWVDVAPDLGSSIIKLCEAVGPSSYYRIDLRIHRDDEAENPDLTLATAYFLEANPTPTIGTDGEFIQMIDRWISRGGLTGKIGAASEHRLIELGKEAVLVALTLWNAEHNALFEPS